MAKVTVQDCLTYIPNQFELVLLSTERARQLSAGQKPKNDKKASKNTVISLREIASNQVNIEELKQSLISTIQGNSFISHSQPEAPSVDLSEIKENVFVFGEDDSISEVENLPETNAEDQQ